jgi:hypothetical protein
VNKYISSGTDKIKIILYLFVVYLACAVTVMGYIRTFLASMVRPLVNAKLENMWEEMVVA